MRSGILANNLTLSKLQEEVLVGLVLGDGCLYRQQKSHNARLLVGQSLKQADFLVWLYEIFKDFVRTPPRSKIRQRAGKQNFEMGFKTLSHCTFTKFYDLFYAPKKIIPENINELLTPIAFAVWFMCDGSIKSKECKGRILNTQSFIRSDIDRLIIILNKKFRLKASIRMQKDGLQIYISAKSAKILDDLLRDRILPSFNYKLPFKI